ncbi:hypothetical protein BDV97DRAFT_288504 [Delphinella strobiligena]|nr:hypothetical protein BDV97DRAFT_288504 [Delphinella strobiligena]
MPFFSKVFKHKDVNSGKSKNQVAASNGHAIAPVKPKYISTWTSKEVDPAEVEELIHFCTVEMKSRAEALDAPFLLLPFRPETDVGPARTFIQNFYTANRGGDTHYTGVALRKELVLTEPAVLCSILKWCWGRMPGGVVTWSTYEGFRMGEQDSLMARNAFSTFIPLSVDSPARKSIIFDFFDLLTAIAAHAKLNGLGGRKLSRMAAWWAFAHSDDGKGFDGGYRSWKTAADASSHLFFAYLRSVDPESLNGFTGINGLPRSLQALVAQTEYPPAAPTLMQRKTPKVVMLVENVSQGPFALLRRAKHFEYRDEELQAFSEYHDPVQALTDECKRVLFCIARANQSSAARSRSGMNIAIEGLGSKPDESWSRFQDVGFSDFSADNNGATPGRPGGLQSAPRSRATNKGRPTTPSWADFLNTGFADDDASGPAAATLLLPPEKILPPLGGFVKSSEEDEDLQPGELASITQFELDDSFWWVWITSLASEEPAERKAVFGRCALVETGILGGRWLVMEEQVKGAATQPEEGAYIAEKKSRFGFSRRGKANRRRSAQFAKSPEPPAIAARALTPNRMNMSPDQQTRIRNAAALLAQQSKETYQYPHRRGRFDEVASAKTNSVLTLGLTSEAGPAMKWAKEFDREAVRKQYLGDDFAGRGTSVASSQPPEIKEVAASSAQSPTDAIDRDLPHVPQEGQEAAEQASPVIELASAKHLPPSTASSSPKITQIERKPVPRTAPRLNNIHEHPAFRNKGIDPAETAAKQAWGTESSTSPDFMKRSGQSGFRKLFGKRKAASSPPAAANLQAPSESSLGRKMSLLRKKPPTGPDSPRNESIASMDLPTPTGQPMDGSRVSRVVTQDQADAEHAFQRFDQGPLRDAPAFTPRESIDSADVPDSPHAPVDIDHLNAPGGFPETPMEFPSPAETAAQNDYHSEASVAPQNRWAQIRKNAAERAGRKSEDQGTQSILTDRTEDDGETSGEETIEARVARIKARVVELTGNIDVPQN